MARKWVLPTAEKQPIENVGARVGEGGALEERACLPHGALGPICSIAKKKIIIIKFILGAWLAFPCQTWCKTTLIIISFFDDVKSCLLRLVPVQSHSWEGKEGS